MSSYCLDLFFTLLLVSFDTWISLLVLSIVSNSYVLFKNFGMQGYILEAEWFLPYTLEKQSH